MKDLIRGSVHYKFVSALKANNCFCGAGKCISEDERSSWHKDVHMFFQENAWVDTKVAVDWVKKTLKPAKEHFKRFALFADNLTISKKV